MDCRTLTDLELVVEIQSRLDRSNLDGPIRELLDRFEERVKNGLDYFEDEPSEAEDKKFVTEALEQPFSVQCPVCEAQVTTYVGVVYENTVPPGGDGSKGPESPIRAIRTDQQEGVRFVPSWVGDGANDH